MRKITLLLISLMTVVTLQLNAQGQDCSNPIVINSLPYTTSDDTANYGDNYTNGDSPCTLYYMSGDDVVYSFTPTSNINVNFTMSNIGSTYSGMHVLDGCVDATPTCVGFSGNSTTDDRVVNADLISGTTYYIVISTWVTPQSTTYDLGITEVACPTPTSLTATPTDLTDADITWTAAGSETNWSYEYGATGFTQGSGTSGTATTNSINLTGLTQGDDYDIYIQANCGGMDGDSTWEKATWNQTLPPPNDDCSGAIALTMNTDLSCTDTTVGTLLGATDSGVMDNGAGTPNDDVWFSFVATNTTHSFSMENVAGSYTDLVHEVLDGSCGSLTSLNVSDNNDSSVSNLTIGNIYYVRVFSYGSTGGRNTTFDVCVGREGDPIVPNYENDFATYPGVGWSEATGTYMMPTGTTSTFLQDDFGNDTGHANGKSARINIFGTGTDEYLISPKFNLSGGTYYLNTDIALTEYNNSNAATLGTDDYVSLLVTQDNGTTWTELTRWDSTSTISNTGEAVSETMLTGYGGEVQFAFYAFSDTTNEDNDFFIDNFRITNTTLRVESNSIENFTLFPTLVKDNLSFTSQEKVDVLTIYNIMGQEVLYRKPTLTNGNINVSSLSNGMYIVKVKAGNSLGSYKIIKE